MKCWLLLLLTSALWTGCGSREGALESPAAPPEAPSTRPEATAQAIPTPIPVSAAGDEVRYQGTNQVRGLAFAAEDALWAATTGGAVRWDLATGTPVQYTAADGMAANYVSDVALGPDGSLWFATLGGVSHLAVDGWTTYTEADGLVDNAVQAIAVTAEGVVWVGTPEGASRFDGTMWTTHRPGDRVWQIAVAPDGAVWFVGDAAGLHRYTPSDETWATFTLQEDPFAPSVKTVTIDPEGAAWVYLGYDQVYRFDGQTWQPVYEAGGQWVCDAAFEADGTPWIATCGGYRAHGAGLVTDAPDEWRHLGREEGLASKIVWAVAIGPGGRIAAGTERGLSIRRAGTWRTLEHGPAINRITSVAVTPDGIAWFGFGNRSMPPAGGGVSRFDGQTWETFDGTTGYPINDNVRLLTLDPDGHLWAAAGCELAHRAADAWAQVAGCEELQGNVIDLAFGPADATWVATDLHVYRLDAQGWRTWERVLPTTVVAAPDGTVMVGQSPLGKGGVWTLDGDGWEPMAESPPCVRKMVVDGAGTVWAIECRGDGLHRWADGAWAEVTAGDGRPHGHVFDVTVSTDGEVWVVAAGGVGHLGAKGWRVREKSWEEDVYEGATTPDHSLWLATSQGAVQLVPFP